MEKKRTTRRQTPIVVLAGLLGLALLGTAHGETLTPMTFSNGGGEITSQDYRLGLSIGQGFGASLSNTSYKMGVGFWYLVDGETSGPVSDVPPIAFTTELRQNAPNPFNPSTTISFTVGKAGPVRLRLYDVQGRIVATLVNEDMGIGEHTLVFQPQGLASGVYLYQLKTADATATRRLMLLK